MVTATSQMKELGEHLKQLEVLNKQSIEKETDAIKQSTYWKERYQGLKEELDKTQGMCEAKDFSKYKKKTYHNSESLLSGEETLGTDYVKLLREPKIVHVS